MKFSINLTFQILPNIQVHFIKVQNSKLKMSFYKIFIYFVAKPNPHLSEQYLELRFAAIVQPGP